MADVTEIVQYYVNLLITQYNGKENARATIELLTNEIWASGIYQDVRDGYDLETAVGVQLDIIGKYVGIDRFYTNDDLLGDYFGFEDANDLGGVSANIVGFDDATSPDKEGLFLDAEDVIANTFALNDDSYRTLIKLRIIQNNSPHDTKDISEAIFQFFGDQILFKDNYDMSITYFIDDVSSNLIEAALQKEVFPKPAGVRLEAISGTEFLGFADAGNLDAIPSYVNGLNDATLGFVKEGGFLDANNDIIS